MILEGMPDPERHRVCRRCGQWFETAEGSLVPPEGIAARSYLRLSSRHGGTLLRFQCHRCTRIRRATQAIIWGTFLGLVAIILLLQGLGLIK